MTTFVLRAGHVLSLDPDVGELPRGDVHVVNGRIEAVGAELDVPPGTEEVDAADRIVMPGFVDTHRHTWQTTMRGMLPGCTLGEYFGAVMIGAATAVTPDDVYAATLLGSYEMLDAGVTSVVDWANANNTPQHADAGLLALREAGIRAMYAYGWPGGPEYLFDSRLPHPPDVRRFAAQHFSSQPELLTFGLALRGPVSTPEDVLRADWGLARDLGARVTVHVGMRVPGVSVHEVEVLDSLGLLGPDATYVHCNETTDHELDRIAQTGGTVSVSAYCESVMGHGLPPTSRFLAHGLRPSLSADVVVTVPGDMFSHMRATYADARSRSLPASAEDEYAPRLTAEDVLRFATVDGAAAMGLQSTVGTLTPGKDADIVMIRTDRVNTMPATDAVATVVTCADTSNVDTVFVRGQAVKRGGQLVGVDLARLKELADSSRDRLVRRLRPGADDA